MFVKLSAFALGFLVVTLKADHSCNSWPNHENFHLIHSGGTCGQVKTNTEIRARIFNGKTAPPGSLPWMAFIKIDPGLIKRWFEGKYKTSCGGSIINKNYILTAAHCVNEDNLRIEVTIGLHNRDILDDVTAESLIVSDYVRHPRYDGKSMYNDIALLRLYRSISFESPFINYICLPTSCDFVGKTLQKGETLSTSGWGLLINNRWATTLQQVAAEVKPCKKSRFQGGDGKEYSPVNTQLCTNVSSCSGDSGGPLVYSTAERAFQVGLLSFGSAYNCSSSDLKPHMRETYTKVANFIEWILDTIKP